MSQTLSSPVKFDPSVETPSDGEAAAIQSLKDSFRYIQDTTSKDYGRAVRGVHAKGHGIVKGVLKVAAGLPPQLAQGLFAQAGSHEAVMRFSTAPGDILDDAISGPRGVALKVLGVEGARLPGSEEDGDQDFLMVNGPVFGAATPKPFAKNLKLLAATTDKAEGLKKAWSATLQVLEGALEAVGGKSMLLSALGGAPETNPLGETYFTQTAYRYGDHIAKLSLVPVSPGLVAMTGDIVDTHGRPDALREEIGAVMVEQGGTWELRVQLCTDPEAMPVEDPTILWDEKLSPFVTVATFEAKPQATWHHATSEPTEDRLSFSPWHCLAAHQPLGAVNRARRETYQQSASFRAGFNRCPVHDVKTLDDLPG